MYKTIKQLDLLSYDKIMSVRRNILRKSKNFEKGSPDSIYIMELELYTAVRFKEKFLTDNENNSIGLPAFGLYNLQFTYSWTFTRTG